MVFDATATLVGVAIKQDIFSLPPHLRPGYWVPLGFIGVIPVSAKVGFDLELRAEASAKATTSIRTGLRQSASGKVGIDFDRSREANIEWLSDFSFSTTQIPVTSDFGGELDMKLKLKPSVSFLVYGLAGMKASLGPSGGVVFEKGLNESLAGYLVAGVGIELAADGVALEWTGARLSKSFWDRRWQIYPRAEVLSITQHPDDTSVTAGEPLRLSAQATGASGITYVWTRDGELAGSGTELAISRTGTSDAGVYHVRAAAGSQVAVSDPATVTVLPAPDSESRIIELDDNLSFGNVLVGQSETRELIIRNVGNRAFMVERLSLPAGFSGNWSGSIAAGTERIVPIVFRPGGVRIYGGTLTVRTSATEGSTSMDVSGAGSGSVELAGMVLVDGGTLPGVSGLGELNVDTFYIGRYEVTWGEWKEVRSWAADNGYDIGTVGNGCAGNHPVHSVNWYDVVKWCNAKSEMEGLTPVYTTGGDVYRTGDFRRGGSDNVNWNTSSDGYRLPDEAEWEFAARGGNKSRGYTYSGSDTVGDVAWYIDNSDGAACPASHGRGTWPVGQKGANELGLYDMSGNVGEWCWDEYRSGTSWSNRGFRGGHWNVPASNAAVATRIHNNPAFRSSRIGFRLARSSGN